MLGGPGFTYVGEWRSDNGAVLEFKNVIDGIEINGVDIITFDAEGRITHFKVMVRPLKAINMLHRLMGEQFARRRDCHRVAIARYAAPDRTVRINVHDFNRPAGRTPCRSTKPPSKT